MAKTTRDARRSAGPIAAKLFRGLGDPARLGLLALLRGGPRSAGDLAQAASLSASNASNHLACLLECGLVEVTVDGRRNLYRLRDPAVARLLDTADELLAVVGPAIEACLNYGPPSRRGLRRDPIAVATA